MAMKKYLCTATAVAMLCSAMAASDMAESAREAARQYGAAIRNCDMVWALDSMYPPLLRSYADQPNGRSKEAEIARARRIQGLDVETKEEARARMAANDKALRARYARMGQEMKKNGVVIESYTVGTPTAEYVVTPPMATVRDVRRDTSGRLRAEDIGSTTERSRVVILPTTLVVSVPRADGGRNRIERRSFIYAVRDEIIADHTQPRDTVLNKWYFIDGNTTVNTLRSYFPNLPLNIKLPRCSNRVLR